MTDVHTISMDGGVCDSFQLLPQLRYFADVSLVSNEDPVLVLHFKTLDIATRTVTFNMGQLTDGTLSDDGKHLHVPADIFDHESEIFDLRFWKLQPVNLHEV